jgi:hypothetical protein
MIRQQRCICAGVMAGLERESAPSSKVIGLVSRRKAFAWKPLAGLAAAASVAGFTLVLTYKLQTPDQALTQATAPVAAPTVTAAAEPAAARAIAVSASAADQQRSWDSLSNEDAQQLDSYLIDYASSRSRSGMGNTLGYARFAAHTAEYHPDGR